jgi:hypothetical protein
MKNVAAKLQLLAVMLCVSNIALSQELFVYTEPASNMPAHAIGIRLNNWLMTETVGGKVNYHLIPELMWGVNKNLMIHAESFVSNRTRQFGMEGGSLYGKYRFYSHDAVYRHFRMAGFGRVSYNSADVHQEEIETNGHNSGFELGWIGTQLLHKQAVSLTLSYEQAFSKTQTPQNEARRYTSQGINYAVSTGRLIFPKAYKDYGQTNFNIMVELLGQYLPERGKAYLDIAPSLQFIFNSQTRFDIGYRQQLYSSMLRTAPNGFLIRLEHVIFNVSK